MDLKATENIISINYLIVNSSILQTSKLNGDEGISDRSRS